MVGKREDILFVLRNSGRRGVTNVELSKIALRYGGYLGSLYEQGYKINKEHLGNGVFNYVLVSEPKGKVIEKPKALDLLIDTIGNKFISGEDLVSMFEEIGLSVKYKAGTHQQ